MSMTLDKRLNPAWNSPRLPNLAVVLAHGFDSQYNFLVDNSALLEK